MPRIFVALRSTRNSFQRMDPQKSLQSIRKIQYWSSSSIFVSRSNHILVENCERYWQICQRSHADPNGKRKLRGNPLQRQDKYWNRHQQVVGTLLLWNKDNGLTLKYRNPKILTDLKSPDSLLDFFDTVKKLIEKKVQESITTKLLMNARKKAIRRYRILVRRNEEAIRQVERRKGFNIAWIRNSCTSEQSKDIREVQSILHCKTMCCYHKVLLSFLPRRKRKRIEVNSESWFDSRRSQSQNKQTSCVLHCCESDG